MPKSRDQMIVEAVQNHPKYFSKESKKFFKVVGIKWRFKIGKQLIMVEQTNLHGDDRFAVKIFSEDLKKIYVIGRYRTAKYSSFIVTEVQELNQDHKVNSHNDCNAVIDELVRDYGPQAKGVI